jgi:hypothetical protein
MQCLVRHNLSYSGVTDATGKGKPESAYRLEYRLLAWLSTRHKCRHSRAARCVLQTLFSRPFWLMSSQRLDTWRWPAPRRGGGRSWGSNCTTRLSLWTTRCALEAANYRARNSRGDSGLGTPLAGPYSTRALYTQLYTQPRSSHNLHLALYGTGAWHPILSGGRPTGA